MSRNLYTLFFLIGIFSGISLNAQIEQDSWLIGGTGSFSSFKSEVSGVKRSIEYDLSPKSGYFIFDKFAAGLSINFSGYNSAGPYGNSYNIFGAGPFLRYYFLNLDKRVNLLFEPSFFWGGDRDRKFSFLGGPTFFLNNKVGLELLGGYTRTRFKGTSKYFDNIPINLGIQVYLNSKTE